MSEMQLELQKEADRDVWFLIKVNASKSLVRTTNRVKANRRAVWKDEIELSVLDNTSLLPVIVYQYEDEAGDVDDFVAIASAAIDIKDVVGSSLTREIHLTEDGPVANFVNYLKGSTLKIKFEDIGASCDSGNSQLGMSGSCDESSVNFPAAFELDQFTGHFPCGPIKLTLLTNSQGRGFGPSA
eukprot:753541-Hanusia_phi.AAC.1